VNPKRIEGYFIDKGLQLFGTNNLVIQKEEKDTVLDINETYQRLFMEDEDIEKNCDDDFKNDSDDLSLLNTRWTRCNYES
jgi:hypothetical protein